MHGGFRRKQRESTMQLRIQHPIPLEDEHDLVHTDDSPFCLDPSCPDKFEPRTILNTQLPEVSPALEESSTAPLSTHWIPLHELIAHWTAVDPLLLPAPVAPLLTAIGHALFALSRETRALHLYTPAWRKQQWHAPYAVTNSRS